MSASTLINESFLQIGSWRTADCQPHRVPWMKYKPGLYAFVVGSDVMYIGMASVLHRRLRNYSRRAFRDINRAPRHVHEQIATCVVQGVALDIYVKIMPRAKADDLLEAETRLIRMLQPVWNRTHIINQHRAGSAL